uniref:Uncharacterized protein n=1 Tax=Anguilla anguilla TaxID=7936 RepID=A0A0E9W7T4_ANGAN
MASKAFSLKTESVHITNY